MAEGETPENSAPDNSGVAAAIAAEAQTTAAEAAGTVAAVEERVETAVEEIAEEVETESAWLREKLEIHETAIRGIAESLLSLPQTIAEIVKSQISEALTLSTQQNSPVTEPTSEKSEAIKANPVEVVAAEITAPVKKAIRLL